MELQVLVSKKGTKVVTATDLYQVLEMPNHQYSVNVKKWLNDFYEFEDGIRKPVRMQDFAPRKSGDNPILDDYYFSIELAKKVVLHSRSKMKLRFAKWLDRMEAEEGGSLRKLSQEQALHLAELTKAMSRVSCQEAAEREHLRAYKTRNDEKANNWWSYRAEVLGYTTDELRDKLRRHGKNAQGKNQRQMLASVDKYELVRAGVIDLFMAIGKTADYARQMGDLAKSFATGFALEITDDREGLDLFSSSANANAFRELQAFMLDAA